MEVFFLFFKLINVKFCDAQLDYAFGLGLQERKNNHHNKMHKYACSESRNIINRD